MRCILCGQRNLDGAIDNIGDFVCVDCWYDGTAHHEGREARLAAPVEGLIPTHYPEHTRRAFVDRANRHRDHYQ